MLDSSDSEVPHALHSLEYALPTTPVVTLRSFYSALDAQIHANALAEAGIAYNLLGSNTNSLGPYNAFTQVDLQVQSSDREAATRILIELEATSGESEMDSELSEAMNEANQPRCPKCASWRTYEVPAPWPGLMNYLLGRSPDRPRQVECLKCHYRWFAPDQQKSE